MTPIELFKQASKSIVVIKTYDDKGKLISFGSGVVLDSEGDVVTNCHVIERAAKLIVVYENKEYAATPKYVDRLRDVCSVAVPGLKAVPVTLRGTSRIEIGSTIYAIGFPTGAGLTFSDGIVSSYRDVPGGHYIQFTAPISPGSSGGGLFDDQAQLIGIPTYFVTQGQLLNFALPVEWIVDLPARHIAQQPSLPGVYDAENDYLTKANELGEKDDLLAEIELCRRWAKAFPLSVRPWELLGAAYADKGDFSKAIDAYRQAVLIIPDSAQNWLEMGSLYGQTGRPQKQIDAYRMAVRIKPEYVGSWYRLAVVYRDSGQFSNAVEASQHVIRINPGHLSAWMILGLSYGKLGQHSEQIDAYEQAIRIDQFSSDAYVSLGVAYHDVHRISEELGAYQQALVVNPGESSALFNLGHYYMTTRNKAKGMEYYARLKHLDPALARKFFDNLGSRVLPAKVKL
jgi:tetratricopeptide (TPR) repeat protein